MIGLTSKYIIGIIFTVLLSALCLVAHAEESSEAQPPPELVIDAPPPTQSPVKHKASESDTETITIYDSKVLPGFRPCTTEDYQNHDIDPVACENEEEARVISTREASNNNQDLIVEEDTVPQGNIFKLKFERFKKNKTK